MRHAGAHPMRWALLVMFVCEGLSLGWLLTRCVEAATTHAEGWQWPHAMALAGVLLAAAWVMRSWPARWRAARCRIVAITGGVQHGAPVVRVACRSAASGARPCRPEPAAARSRESSALAVVAHGAAGAPLCCVALRAGARAEVLVLPWQAAPAVLPALRRALHGCAAAGPGCNHVRCTRNVVEKPRSQNALQDTRLQRNRR